MLRRLSRYRKRCVIVQRIEGDTFFLSQIFETSRLLFCPFMDTSIAHKKVKELNCHPSRVHIFTVWYDKESFAKKSYEIRSNIGLNDIFMLLQENIRC